MRWCRDLFVMCCFALLGVLSIWGMLGELIRNFQVQRHRENGKCH